MEWIAGKDELGDTGFVGEGKWETLHHEKSTSLRR